MRTPPESVTAPKSAGPAVANTPKSHTTGEMLRTPQFYLITATFMFACMGGLMMIGLAKPIAQMKGLVETAAIGVVAIGLANSLGRLFWGFVSDKIGRMNTVFTLLAGAALLSLFVNAATGVWVFVLIAFIGLFYGGILGTFPSLTADIFGTKHMAVNYGFVLIGFGAGAIIASQIAGIYKNLATSKNDISLMFPAFIIASCCAAAGIAMMLILKKLQTRQKTLA
jgi:OFA family oxalate/formate antiporter-like MFS transporter